MTYDIFRLGLVMLSCRFLNYSASHHHSEDNKAKFIGGRYRRMGFQALAERKHDKRLKESSKRRNDSDEEDVLDAILFLKGTQQWDGPDEYMCVGFIAASLLFPTSLPWSQSADLDGNIYMDQMKNFLETFLALKLRRIDIRIDLAVDSPSDQRAAVDCMLTGLDNQTPDEPDKDIDWSTFDRLFENLIV
jgi:hypothetical protein